MIRLVFIVASLFCAGQCPSYDGKLEELDRVILCREKFKQDFEEQMSVIRSRLDKACDDTLKWEIVYALAKGYASYSMDSLVKYTAILQTLDDSSPRQHFLSRLQLAQTALRKRDYDEAGQIVNSLDTTCLSPDLKAELYDYLYIYYTGRKSDLFLEDDKEYDRRMAVTARKEALKYPGLDELSRKRYMAYSLKDDERYKEALNVFINLYDEVGQEHDKAIAAIGIAALYKYLGNCSERVYWLAQSAIHEIQIPERESASLYNLSMELFALKDVSHAAEYIKIALGNAMDGHFSVRIFNSAHALSIISDAALYSERRRHDFYVTMLFILSVGVVLFLALLLHSLFQRKRLLESYNRISSILNQLEEANRIKDSYVFRYMNMSVEYLTKVDDYQHKLRVVARDRGMDALMKELRSVSNISMEYKKFYKVFDSTFLGIFPDFPEKVNLLLKDTDRISLNSDGSMPTSLRILATIRLGMQDSADIAKFLNCALSSVYTHRCKLRAASVCGREDFERKLMEIS